MDTLRESNL